MRCRLNDYQLVILFCCLCLTGWNCATPSYVYRVVTDDCNCTEYRTRDTKNRIDYLFRAGYSMEEGILTTIDVELTNRSNIILSLNLGSVKVSSRNIPYQYNDKFLPLPILDIPPRHSETVHLTGKSVDMKEDWYRIAGEQLTLTLKGLKLGDITLPATTVIFVPENPKLKR